MTRRSLLMGAAVCTQSNAGSLLHSLDVPAGPGSGMPFLTQGLNGSALLSWLEPLGGKKYSLRISRWQDEKWGSPREVSASDHWFINWADFPSIIELESGTLLAHWLDRVGTARYGYGVRIARAESLGASWTPCFFAKPADPEDYSGFLSFTRDDKGAGAVYLAPSVAVHREGQHAGHHEEGHRKTLRALRFDSRGQVRDDDELDSDVCSCCQTTVVAGPKGLIAAYRDRQPGEIRDISIVRNANRQWSKPVNLHPDGWVINGCPTDGPSMALAGDAVGVAWLTRAKDNPKIQAAFSTGGDKPFSRPIRIDDGNPLGRPSVAALGGDLLVVWIEKVNGEPGAEVKIRKISPRGVAGKSLTVSSVVNGRTSGFPKVVVVKERILLAWREDRVRCAAIDAEKVL